MLCFGLLLAGCAKDFDMQKFEHKQPEEIFREAKGMEDAKNYSLAAEIFEELEKLYPYSKLVPEAQLHAGDCNYKLKKYEEATTTYEIFVKTHPTHAKVPYALYMLGLINYEQMPIIERDQELTAKSITYFGELFKKYPNCEYIKQAEVILKKLRQQMAGREVYVARYYLARNNYAAAVGRLNTVVEVYKDTDHGPEAMLRLVECYVAMGLFNEAKLVNDLLQKDFKNTKWAGYAKNLLKKYQNEQTKPSQSTNKR